MKKTLLIILLPVLLNACTGPSLQFAAEADEVIQVDRMVTAKTLAGALTYETILNQDAELNEQAFLEFHQYLRSHFPLAHEHLEIERINGLSLLYTWKGTNTDLDAVLFLSHQDVVPAENPEKWQHPPFAGHYDENYIYGRGAIDVKFGVLGVLEATEKLLASGFVPRRTLMFAFGHDEELMGTRGGEQIARYMAQNDIRVEFILDEGPAVMADLIPGVSG